MNFYNSILDPIARPIAWVLAAFYSVIPNYGVAIIGLSILWMLIIAPLTLKSTRSMLAMQALQPEIKRLQEKHRNDRQALTQATMDLYKERNVSPFSSCLPSILPLPVFIALFRVIDGLSHTVTVNGVKHSQPLYLDHHTAMFKSIEAAHGSINAFGLNLANNAFSHHSSAVAAIPFFVLLLIMIGTSYLQTAMMMNRNPAASQNPQMKMMKYLPIVFGIICARFPAGVVLYYAVSNICRIGQQYSMYKWDPKVKALVTEEVREVEARTHDLDEGRRAETGGNRTPPRKRQGFREMLAEAREQGGQSKAPPNRPQKGSGGTKGGGAGGGGGGAAARPADRPGSVKANRDRQARRPDRTTGANGSVKGSNKTSGKNPTGSKPVSGGGRSGNSSVAKSSANGSGRSGGRPDATPARTGASTSPRNRRRRRS